MEGEAAMSDQALLPIYGNDRLKAIREYIRDFDQYKSNFPPQTPVLREAGARKLLLLQCPVSVVRSNGAVNITLGLLFTNQFPDHPPHCAVLLKPGERLCPNHALVAGNGVIRLPQLPFLQGSDHPSLCDILLAVTDAFEHQFPIEESTMAAPPASAAPTQPVGGSPPQQQTQAQAPPPPQQATPPQNHRHFDPQPQQVQPAPPPASVPPASTPAGPRPEEKLLAEKVLLDLRLKGEDYIRFRRDALEHQRKLQHSLEAHQHRLASLQQQQATLLSTAPEMHKVAEMVKDWKADDAMPNASSCLVPPDELHKHAMELLAKNHAADDVMELLEKKLRRGLITVEDYLKAVSDIARQQFIARLLLKRTYARIHFEGNCRRLVRQFPTFDQSMIGEVLRNAGYDYESAQSRLQELTA